MRRFLNKLFRDFRTTSTARGGRRAPRGAALQVEGLEDRLVLSTATLTGSTLAVTVSAGTASHLQQITFQADPHKPGFLDVLDDGILLGGKSFAISSIKHVTVSVAGFDSVTVDDSNGLPFASEVNVSLSGKGTSNSLTLTGSRAISAGELEGFTAGDGATDGSLDTLDGNTFKFSNAIGSVTDSIPSTAGILVDAFGSKVTLSGSNGVTQRLSGLSIGGAGDTFTFSNKGFVGLGIDSAGASASLNATVAAAGEKTFSVALTGNRDTVNIDATPSTVQTFVLGGGVNGLNTSQVNLLANSGVVHISGGKETTVILGQPTANGSVTSGIKANVFVTGVGDLSVVDNGNRTTQEHVTVTETTVSGTGLFGNNAVTLNYSDTTNVVFLTGQLAETYLVSGDTKFGSNIDITSASPTEPLNLGVVIGSEAGLNLTVSHRLNLSGNATSSLSVIAPGGKFSEPTPPSGPPFFDGTVDVNFVGGLTSVITFTGIQNVNLEQ